MLSARLNARQLNILGYVILPVTSLHLHRDI
jgi:hypothetical protein